MKDMISKLKAMRLSNMANEILRLKEEDNGLLTYEEKLQMIVDKEWNSRQEKKINSLIKKAHLKIPSAYLDDNTFDDVIFKQGTKEKLLTFHWVDEGKNVVLCGPTGCGKTHLACALSIACISQFHTVLYTKAGLLIEDLQKANAEKALKALISQYNKYDILIIDDFGLMSLDEEVVRPLFELIDSRENSKSLIVASQLPFDSWYDLIKEATYADAILDRLFKYSYKLDMSGSSKRQIIF